MSGVRCTAGARQVGWSKYAPPCESAFHGPNGGATSYGVTATSITIAYRESTSSQDAAVQACCGSDFEGDSQYLQDLSAYLPLFNRDFELYGRKVVFKPFNGQGDWLLEAEGQDLAAAQADAATAHDLGAFADLQNPLSMTAPYAGDLASERIVAFDSLGLPQAFYSQYQPYEYSYIPTLDKGSQWVINAVCERMAGLPAIYAGDPATQRRTRVFGLLVENLPDYKLAGDFEQRGLAGCGTTLAKRVDYAFDPASEGSEAPSIVAQMKAAGVTTLICNCEPNMETQLTNQADAQGWNPEYLTANVGDAGGRLPSQKQWSHAIATGSILFATTVPQAQAEAYRAFKLADPSAQPNGFYYGAAYYSLMQLFDLLQAAGPDLTPATLAQAMTRLPASALGDHGVWQFGPTSFTPSINTQITRWSATAPSYLDGKPGSYVACEGGAFVPFGTTVGWGNAHTQLRCSG